MSLAVISAIIMTVLLIVMLVMGASISIAIGLSSAVAMLCMLPVDISLITSAQRIFTGANSFSLIAIPFFILAGNIMNNGGIAVRLVNVAKALSGRMPGALAQSNVVANMMFGAISGSGAAATAAIGGTMGPLEEQEGYDKVFSTAVNIASAPTGMLIPPSNLMIVYSTVAGSVSVAALFVAGYVPGISWGIGVMALVAYFAKKKGYVSEERVDLKTALHVIVDAIPSLLLIVIIIRGILALTSNKYAILILMNIIILIVGTFMDPTPPVGSILFTGCKVGGVSIENVMRQLLPYFFVILLLLILVTYVPAVSMTLPTLAGLV